MSTDAVVIEPPKKTEAPAGSTPLSVIIPDMETILKGAGNAPKKAAAVPEKKAEEPAKAEEKATDKATDKVVEKVPEKAAEKKPEETAVSDKDKNWQEVRKKLETEEAGHKAAKEELARLKSELEAAKAIGNPDDIKSKLENYEKELSETKTRLRQADLSRDPEFRAKYTTGINSKVQVMADIATEAGITAADWKRAVSNWNEDQFGEWAEAMTPSQRVKFTAAWTGAVQLYQEQNEAIQNADKTWNEMEESRKKQQEERQKSVLTDNERLARSVLDELVSSNDALKDYTDLAPAAEAAVMAAARYQMTPKDVFHNVVANQVLARVTQRQNLTIEDLQKQILEKDKKLSEQEAFIKDQAGSVPRGDGKGDLTTADDKTPIWERIVVPRA